MQLIHLLAISPVALAATIVESLTQTETITSCAPGVTDCPASPVIASTTGNSTEPTPGPTPSENVTTAPVPTYVDGAAAITLGAGMVMAAGLGALLI